MGDDMEKIIMHVDVNNAFLSWSAIYLMKNGLAKDIRKEVSVIGGDEKLRHGVVLSKSDQSKKYGIKTGEPIRLARKKYPNLKIYPPNFSFYSEMSNKLFNLIRTFTPDIEIVSVDECYIDYTKVKNLYKDPLEFAQMLQKTIWDKLGFTVNIGIASNKLCSKMASDFSKPNKIHTLFPNEIENKLWPLPIEELHGVGKSSAKLLRTLNINTIYDLAHSEFNKLYPLFKNRANKLIMIANGIDDDPVNPETHDPKGISASITFPYDYENKKEIENTLDALIYRVVNSLRKQKKQARVIAVFFKDSFFETVSKQKKLKNATDITEEVSRVAKNLFSNIWNEEPIRLVGIRLDDLTNQTHYQMSLFENFEEREHIQKLDSVIYEINEKFGKNVVIKANIIDKKTTK